MIAITPALRRLVTERAQHRCEYCLRPQWFSVLSHQVDHIIALKHGGETNDRNLCLSCARCNRIKGSDIASLDPATGQLTALFHPRQEEWSVHFRLNGAQIEGLTPQGRTTVRLLHLNDEEQVELRAELIAMGHYPLP